MAGKHSPGPKLLVKIENAKHRRRNTTVWTVASRRPRLLPRLCDKLKSGPRCVFRAVEDKGYSLQWMNLENSTGIVQITI